MSVPVDPDFEAQAFALVPIDRCPCGRTTTRDLLISRVTWEEHPDERAMLDAERIAITEEDPALNKAGIR